MFERMQTLGHEALHVGCDPRSGLQAMIAIHDTRLGPALGGCRFVRYDSEQAALEDVLRLSRGMSYKAALAGLPFGGGKAVIIKPVEEFNRETIFLAFGDFVESLSGQYVTAVDSGSTVDDLAVVAQRTRHVTSASRQDDPSPWTALGVFVGMAAAARVRLGAESLARLHVAIQGVGNVGYPLALRLRAAGVRLSIADVDEVKARRLAKELDATLVSPQDIHRIDCDVFAPCGLGAVINSETLPELQCQIVAGSANNQLADESLATQLHTREILYAPDYVINAGGLIAVALRHTGKPDTQIETRTRAIGATLEELFRRSEKARRPALALADEYAQEVIARGPQALEGDNSLVKAVGL